MLRTFATMPIVREVGKRGFVKLHEASSGHMFRRWANGLVVARDRHS
jgi:hypothetical protein